MLFELLSRGATQAPERPVVIGPGGTLTYAEAAARAGAAAADLRERGITRFGIAASSAPQTLVALAASAAAGAQACVYPRDLDDGSVDRIATEFGHAHVLTGEPRALHADALLVNELGISTGPAPPAPESAPVLILTTGTTGAQKGAEHDWRRLAAGVRAPDTRPGNRWLLAYNLNQFAGIQILLHALTSAATLVAPRSSRAEDAIESLHEFGATHVSATPTFWRLLAGRLDHDQAARLGLEQITLGGEAAPASLLERLRELFPAARLTHVYAGTEFGSAVAVRDGLPGLPASVLDRPDDADVQLRVIDGELHVRSRYGMTGYHGVADRTDGFRATGDLVEIRGGRVHFVGRTTEIINVGGAKVHPLPVEETIARVGGVELVAVYGRPNAITGQIVAADVVAAPGTDHAGLKLAIQAACEVLPRPGRPRRIRFVDALDTKGDKLLRREAGSAA